MLTTECPKTESLRTKLNKLFNDQFIDLMENYKPVDISETPMSDTLKLGYINFDEMICH